MGKIRMKDKLNGIEGREEREKKRQREFYLV